ncbi:MAG TPA: helix-turn-helix domain-containing protein [Polyangiales bacterium]
MTSRTPATVPQAVSPPGTRPGPVGGKRDRNRRARSEGLLAAAEQLFLQRGIEDVSIDDITRQAGVAKGSFYRYFPSKEALVRAMLAPSHERVVSAFERAEEQLKTGTSEADLNRAYLRLGRELLLALLGSPNITRLYLQESRAPAVHARVPVRELETEVARLALRVTEAAFSQGLIRKAPPQVSTLAVIGAAERLLTAYFDGTLEVEPAVAVQALVEIILRGMQ